MKIHETLDQINPKADIEPIFSPRFKRTLGKGLRKLIGPTVKFLLLAGYLNYGAYEGTRNVLESGQYNTRELREEGLNRSQEEVNPEDMHWLDNGAYHLLEFMDYISKPGIELACRQYEKNSQKN